MNTPTIRARSGFTLIEIAVVLLIASVVLSMTFLSFSSYSERAAARGAAETFASDLRVARSFSARAHTPVKFTFKEDSAIYRVVTLTGDTLAQRYFDGRGEFRVDSIRNPLRGDTLTFMSDGAIDFSALRITSGYAIFGAGGRTYRVNFNATGSSQVVLVP